MNKILSIRRVSLYYKKSRASAILIIITAALLIGFMILLRFLQFNADDASWQEGFAVIFTVIFGYPLLYASSVAFSIVAIIFGILMLRQQSRKKLISLNKRMLIATCVLLPFIALAMYMINKMIFKSTLGAFPIVYAVTTWVAYIAGLIAQIVTIILLKKSPEESVSPATE